MGISTETRDILYQSLRMFSDIYKIKESENGMMIEVEGKMISRSEGDIDDALIGGNASAEVQDEGCDSSTVSGVDIVLNHKLQETSYDKKSYTAYIKDYMKAVKAKLQEVSPDRVDPFMANAPAEVKKILGNIKNYQNIKFKRAAFNASFLSESSVSHTLIYLWRPPRYQN
uniref:Tumor protein, translationally-controlled 1 n=1 Tax=Sinocyclocheilus rhinocerous TaxID=307959 RepID=A0A673MN82_9TELE